MVVGRIEHKTKIRFKNMDDFESYLNEVDIDYGSENFFYWVCLKIKNTSFQCC